MLVLTRRINESIDLLDDETGETLGVITLIAVGRNHARLGFVAPARVRVLRGELRDRDTVLEGASEPEAA